MTYSKPRKVTARKTAAAPAPQAGSKAGRGIAAFALIGAMGAAALIGRYTAHSAGTSALPAAGTAPANTPASTTSAWPTEAPTAPNGLDFTPQSVTPSAAILPTVPALNSATAPNLAALLNTPQAGSQSPFTIAMPTVTVTATVTATATATVTATATTTVTALPTGETYSPTASSDPSAPSTPSSPNVPSTPSRTPVQPIGG